MATTGFSTKPPEACHQPLVDRLRALADLVAAAAGPPWLDASFDGVMWRVRGALRDLMDGDAGITLRIAGEEAGFDDGALYPMAADDGQLRCWVADLIGPTTGQPCSRRQVAAVAALLRVHLYNDELAFLGLVAEVLHPRRPTALAS